MDPTAATPFVQWGFFGQSNNWQKLQFNTPVLKNTDINTENNGIDLNEGVNKKWKNCKTSFGKINDEISSQLF